MKFAQALGKRDRRRIPCPAGAVAFHAYVNQAVEEGPRSEHNRCGFKVHTQLRQDTHDPIAGQDQVVHRLLEHCQAGLALNTLANCLPI